MRLGISILSLTSNFLRLSFEILSPSLSIDFLEFKKLVKEFILVRGFGIGVLQRGFGLLYHSALKKFDGLDNVNSIFRANLGPERLARQ